jgi:hypothetical protein
MVDKIKTRTILIEEGAYLPESLRFESEPYLKGWRLVKNLDSSAMDRSIRKAGWTFFFMASEVHATAVGSDLEKTTRRAVKKVIAYMKSDRLNCLEITQVAAKRFLGLPYVTVSAHPRHIQESIVLFRAKRLAEWDRAKLAAASTKAWGSRGRELCQKEMVTKPGLAENAGARFYGGSVLANCERYSRRNDRA